LHLCGQIQKSIEPCEHVDNVIQKFI
jgi:hypothetical protein